MLIEIKLEELFNNLQEAKVTGIYKKPGDKVEANDLLLNVEANKSNLEIYAKVTGVIESINVAEGDNVKIGDTLAIVNGVKEEKEVKATSQEKGYFASLLSPKKQELEADITIIGGGPGGYVAAIKAAQLGAKVILIEKDAIGGTCLNRGCIPTKSLVRSAEIFTNIKDAEEYGCQVESFSLDMKKVISRKNNIVNQLVQGINYLLEKQQVKVIQGTGKLLDTETVYVKNDRQETYIKTKDIIIATGSKISRLPIPGADIENVIDSDKALQLEELPQKLVIVGGGVIGMEFAFIFANFGVDVSVVEYFDEILANCDCDICNELERAAQEKGIKIYKGSKVTEFIKAEDGKCVVSFECQDKIKYITADKVLLAVGREPELNELDIDKVDVELNENGRGIKVNEKMQTNIPNIYAIGDVTNKVLLAHVASHQGIVAVKNIMGESCHMEYDAIPSAIFTDPEIAVVGIGEKSALKAGLDIEIGKFPFAANGKALTLGEARGFIKIIKDKTTNRIIGGAIIGPHATDLITDITLAIKNHLTVEQIIETIYAHPTTAEVVNEAALALAGGAIHFAD